MAVDRAFVPRLQRLLRRVRLHLLGHGLVRTLATVGAAGLAAAWAVGGGNEPGGFIAWGLALSLAAILGITCWRHLIRPLLRTRRARDLVADIESRGDFANILVAAEEADRLPARWAGDDPVRLELLRRLSARAIAVLDLLAPGRIYPRPRLRVWLGLLAVVSVLAVAAQVRAPGELGRGFARLAAPGSGTVVPPTIGLYGMADPRYVIAGSDADLAALDFAGGDGSAVAEIRTGSGLWQPVATAAARVDSEIPGIEAPYRKWTATVADVREDFAWRFRRGTLVSAVQEVVVRHHPLVTRLGGSVYPPAYTRLAVRELKRLPAWFEVPAGSTLRLTGRVNHPVRRALLVNSTGDTLQLAADSLVVSGSMVIDRTTGFRLVLEDSFGLQNESPLLYEVSAAADQVPAVSLELPGNDGILPIAGELGLEVEAADDFGLSDLRLLFRTLARDDIRSGDERAGAWEGGSFWPGQDEVWREFKTVGGAVRVKPLRTDGTTSSLRARFDLQVEAGALDLVSGDVLEIVAEARDNKVPGPVGTARSRVLRLTLPSAADVLAEHEATSDERQAELEEMRRRSGELDADLDRLNRELMKNPLPDWARQKEMENTIERQKTLQEELARIAEQLQRELDNLARNQLTSEAQLDKADEIAELLSQPGAESLQELMEKMEDPGQEAGPDEVARAIREVARNQKDMARKLDAALAMLKRMAQEQELEGLASLLEKMIQKQQELADLSRKMEEMEARQEADDSGDQLAQGDTEPQDEPGDEASGDPSDKAEAEQDKPDGEAGEQGGESPEGQDGAPEPGETPDMPTPEEMARRQEALAEELAELQEKLEEALAELQEKNADQESSPADSAMETALKKALEQMEENSTQEKMSKASEEMMKMDPGETAEMQEQALRDLGSLYHIMVKTQEAMQMAMKMEQVSSLRGLAADMLALSTRQEEIVATIPPQLQDLRDLDLTRRQHRLQKATVGVRDNLAGLLDEAPTRIMKLLAKLDDLVETMGAGVRAMEDNRAPVARQQARASLAAANNMVIGLLTEAQMAGGSGGGSGSSMPMLSQQLQKMAEEQSGLNGSTEELRRMLADRGMSQEARAAMQRLGEAQAGLAGRMGELAEEERERPEGERLLGDLGGWARTWKAGEPGYRGRPGQ